MNVALKHFHWHKHSISKASPAVYKAKADYHVDELGTFAVEAELPIALAEQIDSLFQSVLWQKIGKVRLPEQKSSESSLTSEAE